MVVDARRGFGRLAAVTSARNHASGGLVSLLLVLAGIMVLSWPSRPDLANTAGPILASVRATTLVLWALFLGVRARPDARWNLAHLTLASLVTAPLEASALWAGHGGSTALWSVPYATVLTLAAYGVASLGSWLADRIHVPQLRFVLVSGLVALLVVLDAALGPPFWLPWVATMTPSWTGAIATGLMALLTVIFTLYRPAGSGLKP